MAQRLDPLWVRAHRLSLLQVGRQRQIGAGRQFKLDVPHRLFLSLLYLRHYLPMHFLGVLFEMDAANVCRNIHALLPLLEQAVPAPLRARTPDSRKVIPNDVGTRRRLRTLEDVLDAFPEIADLIIDGTEQPRGQPKKNKGSGPGKKALGDPKTRRSSSASRRARTPSKPRSPSLRMGLSCISVRPPAGALMI